MSKLKLIQQMAWAITYLSMSALMLTLTTLFFWNLLSR
jgi:hypothetical protein